MAENYYEILGVDRDADLSQIKRAYREAAKKYHPDINKAEGSDELFMIFQTAYETLKDKEKRSAYDRTIRSQTYQAHDQDKNEEPRPHTQRQPHSGSEPKQQAQAKAPAAPRPQKLFFKIIRWLLVILLLVVIPVTEFAKNQALIYLVVYYGLMIILYLLLEAIYIFSISYMGITLIKGFVEGNTLDSVYAVLAILCLTVFVLIIKPTLFQGYEHSDHRHTDI